jgi:hypothetical protein
MSVIFVNNGLRHMYVESNMKNKQFFFILPNEAARQNIFLLNNKLINQTADGNPLIICTPLSMNQLWKIETM